MRGGLRLHGFSWQPLGRAAPTLGPLDLVIEPGERVLLTGPSGSGKSTLLHAAAGALGTTLAGNAAGSIDVDGRLGLLVQNPRDAIVAEHVGRDVAFGPENLGLPREEIWRLVDDALESVGLDLRRDHFTAALSGGEQQSLALAGALAADPDLLLLDEPTAMLDSASAATVRDAVAAVIAGRTLIVAEHRFADWLPHVDRVIALDGGTVAFDGGVEEFLAAAPVAGLWMPGDPSPDPLMVPAEWVRPDEPVRVTAERVDVTLRTRSLRGTQTTQAVRGMSVELEPGTVSAFVGPSGSGKSTALGVLGGLLKPTGGAVTPALHRRRSPALVRTLGWVPQNPEFAFLTTRVGDEVTRTAHRLGTPVDPGDLLAHFGLGHLAAAHPFRLSGGEQRRLATVAALAHRPPLVLLDEPTVGQDRFTWAAVVGWIAAAAAAGATVALSTHDEDLPADHVLRVAEGIVT